MIEILAISCLSVLFVVAEPMIILKRKFGFREEDYEDWSYNKRLLFRLITCALCSGFWLGAIITLNIYKAAIISILAEYIYKKII